MSGSLTTFDSPKIHLSALLDEVEKGKIQLPDFQRGWIWDDSHIRSLLASVSLTYPIGALMMLQTGNPAVKFRPRPIQGVALGTPLDPDSLVLDGQQRLTSLYLSMKSKSVVKTRDDRSGEIDRWYYLDIEAALDSEAEREDAIKSIPEDKKVRSNFGRDIDADYSTIQQECSAGMLPLNIVFDYPALTNWQMHYLQSGTEGMERRLEKWNELNVNVLHPLQQYQLPVIILGRSTPKEAVCQVFEKVNTGGVALTVFELLTATFATDNFNLRDDWSERRRRLRDFPLLHGVASTDFLQCVTLLVTYERHKKSLEGGGIRAVSCRRRDILRLEYEQYDRWAESATNGFIAAARFLQAESVFKARDLPYQSQLVPLAAMFAVLGDRAQSDSVRRKLSRWYWCGVFGELYGGALETRLARDLPEVLNWIAGEQEPDTIVVSEFAPDRLLGLRTRNSAAYKGLNNLLVRDGARDFRTGEAYGIQNYFDDAIDIHHVFPRKWCSENSVDSRVADCIVNKTPLSSRTNRTIGGSAPSTYLDRIQRGLEIPQNRMNEILNSHVIEPGPLRSDDFASFFDQRKEQLLSRIEQATGKQIARRATLDDVEVFARD